MIMKTILKLAVVCVFGASAVACASSREVEVTGEVAAPAGVSVQGAILVDFLDIVDEEEAPKSVVTATLSAPGPFTQKGDFEGDKILVRAINDKNGDGACSAGEAWAETEAPIGDDDSVEPVKLTLGTSACPAP
jgi:hypothetical protein